METFVFQVCKALMHGTCFHQICNKLKAVSKLIIWYHTHKLLISQTIIDAQTFQLQKCDLFRTYEAIIILKLVLTVCCHCYKETVVIFWIIPL